MSIIEQVQKAAEDADAKARKTYHAILRRSEKPKEGDVGALRAAMLQLVISPANLRKDVEILRQADKLKAKAAVADEALDAEVSAAHDLYAPRPEATAAIIAERKVADAELFAKFTILQARRSAGLLAEQQLRTLEKKNWELFGLEAPVVAVSESAQMIGQGVLATIPELQENSINPICEPQGYPNLGENAKPDPTAEVIEPDPQAEPATTVDGPTWTDTTTPTDGWTIANTAEKPNA